MADPEEVTRIRLYLRRHRYMYSQDALRRKLLDDGHDPRAVKVAMAQVYGVRGRQHPIDRALGDSGAASVAFAGMVVVNGLGLWLLFRWGPSLRQGSIVVGAVVALELSTALLCWFWSGYRAVARGILVALVVVVGMLGVVGAVVALLFGTCMLLLKELGA